MVAGFFFVMDCFAISRTTTRHSISMLSSQKPLSLEIAPLQAVERLLAILTSTSISQGTQCYMESTGSHHTKYHIPDDHKNHHNHCSRHMISRPTTLRSYRTVWSNSSTHYVDTSGQASLASVCTEREVDNLAKPIIKPRAKPRCGEADVPARTELV